MNEIKVNDRVVELANIRHTYRVTEVNPDRLAIIMVDEATGTRATVSFGSFPRFFAKL